MNIMASNMDQHLKSYKKERNNMVNNGMGKSIMEEGYSFFSFFFQGETLLGSLGGIFSRTWKPKKSRPITGPAISKSMYSFYIFSIIMFNILK